jgi:hypothetical protein
MQRTIEQFKEIVTHAWEQLPAEIHRSVMSVVSGAIISLPGTRRSQYFKRALGNWGISGIVRHLERHLSTHAPMDFRRRSIIHRPQPAIWELLEENRHLFRRSNSNSRENRWHSTLKHKQHASLLETQSTLDKRARSRARFDLPKTLRKGKYRRHFLPPSVRHRPIKIEAIMRGIGWH